MPGTAAVKQKSEESGETMAAKEEERITADEFLNTPETNIPIQLINGRVITLDSHTLTPTPEHQDVVGEIFLLLKSRAKILGGRAFIAPLDVEFEPYNVPQPNVLWVAPDSQCHIADKRLIGAPDLIVEVLSPSTAKSDRIDKFHLYERHGVREYWIADPHHALIEIWTLREGKFDRLDVYGRDSAFPSPLMGEVEVNAIFGTA